MLRKKLYTMEREIDSKMAYERAHKLSLIESQLNMYKELEEKIVKDLTTDFYFTLYALSLAPNFDDQ